MKNTSVASSAPWSPPLVREVCSVTGIVPDHESRDRDVILVRRTINLGEPRGVGKLERGRNGEREVSL